VVRAYFGRVISSRLHLLTPIAGALALALPALAEAAPPQVKSTRIVVHESIGGVGIGQPLPDARAVWGKGVCVNAYSIINGGGGGGPRGLEIDKPGACDFGLRNKGAADFYFLPPRSESETNPVALIAGVRVSAAYLGDRIVFRPGHPPRSVPRFAFAKPFTRFTTTKGIHLGSTEATLKRKYPGAKRRSGDAFRFGRPDRLEVPRSGSRHYVITTARRQTAFTVEAGRVTKIAVVGDIDPA
jgi:hypothetical protein